jgi:hypothetical protein
MASVDDLQEVQVLALRKYGRPLEALSEDEKQALYRDYAGEREVAGAKYTQGAEMLNTAMPEGRQIGQQFYAANPLETLGAVAKSGVGGYMMKKSSDELKDLSKDYQLGSRAGGDVAANQNSQYMNLLSQAIRGAQAPQGAPAAPQPQAPAAAPAQAAPAAPQQAQGPAPVPALSQGAPVPTGPLSGPQAYLGREFDPQRLLAEEMRRRQMGRKLGAGL